MTKLVPRDYQKEAVEWALKKKKAVICMPTGTGKTLIAALWIKEIIKRREANKILVLEPTRFLVEQTHNFLTKQKINSSPLHGSLPSWKRDESWKKPVIVATPEIIVAEWKKFLTEKFDAIVIDECHHTTGKDAYKTVITQYDFKLRLGLTPYIPSKRKKEIIENIGTIKCWSWKDPRIKAYLPIWQTEIYEAPLNKHETLLYEALNEEWGKTQGKLKALIGNAIRWFVRDGLLALVETIQRSRKLREAIYRNIEKYLGMPGTRKAHKLDALQRVLEDHEGFQKTIVFVDRIIIAQYINEEVSNYNPVMILGRKRIDPRKALISAKKKDKKIIISTSAGEEGIDLPEADLLVIWSNTSSPLRFIQRMGRILRAVTKQKWRPRWIVFITTPETIDTDSLIDGLLEARKAGATLDVEPETIEYLWSLSEKRKFLTILEKKPLPIEVLAKAAGAPLEKTRLSVKWMLEKGFAAYIYTPIGRVYLAKPTIKSLYKEYRNSLTPCKNYKGKITVYRDSKKLISFTADYNKAIRKLDKILYREGEIDKITVSVATLPKKGIQKLLNLHYSYKITDKTILKMILDNAFSNDIINGNILLND